MPIITCPACGGAIPDGARFCPSCGRPVSVAGGEERKLATIVFADLTDSTQLATRMDAEALRALLADVYDQLSQVVASFGGTVEKFIGDAIMAVFGVPTAHEDDPERAVRAALGMRSRLTGIARRHGQDLILRVGVNTGVVATGSTSAATSWSPATPSTSPPGCSRRPSPARCWSATAPSARSSRWSRPSSRAR